MASTYGAWFTSLFLETILYGIGILQTFLYFQWSSKDSWSIKTPVLVVLFLETTQILFFFRSSYFRFVQSFGVLLGDLIWSDSLQLLANYLSAFTVQLYFATRIYRLTHTRIRVFKYSVVGIYIVVLLAVTQMAAGLTQTILTYKLRSYAKLEQTKAITTLQTAASLACDIVITLYLCFFFAKSKSGLPRTERLLNSLMINAVNRGMLTAISSALTMILFLVSPHTLWFFLSIAPNSKLYMNSMLATLNMRDYMGRKIPTGYSVDLGSVPATAGQAVSAVEFVHPVTIGTVDSQDTRGTSTTKLTESDVTSTDTLPTTPTTPKLL
ncbi:hypothetical protein C8R46DRAFT_1362551 [Mycena filopes]|nr:hypothetical protein C8R46DRAFT_1362551 [Mycena filopes]